MIFIDLLCFKTHDNNKKSLGQRPDSFRSSLGYVITGKTLALVHEILLLTLINSSEKHKENHYQDIVWKCGLNYNKIFAVLSLLISLKAIILTH